MWYVLQSYLMIFIPELNTVDVYPARDLHTVTEHFPAAFCSFFSALLTDVNLYNVEDNSWSAGPTALPSGQVGTRFLDYKGMLITFNDNGALAYDYSANDMWTENWPDGVTGVNYGYMGIPVLFKSF